MFQTVDLLEAGLADDHKIAEVLSAAASGKRSVAVNGLEELAAAAPALGDKWLSIAGCAVSLGEMTLGVQCVRHYVAGRKFDPGRLVHAAGILAEAGRHRKALDLVESLVASSPADPSVHHLCGTVLQQMGEREKAANHLLKALQEAPLAGVTWLTFAAQNRFAAEDPMFDRLMELREPVKGTESANQVQFMYALGKAMLDRSEHDAAFDVFSAAAALVRESSRYDAEKERQRIGAIIAENDKNAFSAVAEAETDDAPIFVIGLPRSGTTLVQRLLSAHPDVGDGGEFSGLGLATMELRRGSGASLRALSRRPDRGAESLQSIAALYDHLVQERFGTGQKIVDKSIANTQFVGLIAKVFPESPIILVERDLLDTAWSCFRTCFSRGQHWSWSLQDIATHFATERRLLAYWQDVLPQRITTISYEELVSNPDVVVPRLLESCGLEFDARVFDFHLLKQPVTTASVVQVGAGITKAAVGSAQHVRQQMAPFVDAYREAVRDS